MNQCIQKVKKHVSDNSELYFMYAVGIGVGVVATRMVFGTPKVVTPIVSPAAVLNAWHEGVVAAGKHVFLLTSEQAELWQNCWEAAKETARQTSINNPEYLRGMAEGARRVVEMGA